MKIIFESYKLIGLFKFILTKMNQSENRDFLGGYRFLIRIISCTHICLIAYFNGDVFSASRIRNFLTYRNKQLSLVATFLVA